MIKIKRINKVSNFGSYLSYSWEENDIEEFQRYNILYGWNYSGKTTLSRMFAFLQKPELPEAITGSFEAFIEDDDSKVITIDSRLHNKTLPVRVFNADFVNTNFEQEHNAPAVHVLGENVRYLRDEIKKRREQIERQKKIKSLIRSEQENSKREVDQKKTDCARIINALIGGRYNRKNLEKHLSAIRFNPASYFLGDNLIEGYKKTLALSGEFDELSETVSNPPDILSLLEEVNGFLVRNASNLAIDELKNDIVLENWLREGLKIHEEKNMCGFCGGPLDTSVFDRLQGHFNREQEKLRDDISRFLQKKLPKNFELVLPKIDGFLPHLRERYNELWMRGMKWKDQCDKQLNDLRLILEKKLESGLDRTIKPESFPDFPETWSVIKNNIVEIINNHNYQVGDTDTVVKDARERIEKHYIAELCEEFDFNKIDTDQGIFEKRLDKRRSLINICEQRIKYLENEIRKKSVAASKLNELLKILLPSSNVRAYPLDKSTFEFQRDGYPAKNLSDGEKTAITFAYFLITLKNHGENLEDLIVFIDDPISSLDSNHIYTVWSLINESLKECKQLFVSTHNNEFFTLIKDEWINKRQKGFGKNYAGYLVSRYIDKNGKSQSKLENLPDLLLKYKSEYQFVYSCLYKFANTSTPSLHEAYTAPNLLRKFLEAYLGFRRPSGGAWHNKLDLLIDCPVRRKEIHKFTDDASHTQKPVRITEHPSYLANAQNFCSEIFEALKSKDQEHYDSLKALI